MTNRKALSLAWATAIYGGLAAYALCEGPPIPHLTSEVIGHLVVVCIPVALFSIGSLCYVIFDITCQVRFRLGWDKTLIDTRMYSSMKAEGFATDILLSRVGTYRSAYTLAIIFTLGSTLYLLPGIIFGRIVFTIN